MTLTRLLRGPNYPDFPCGGVPKRALHGAAIGPMVLLEGTPTSPSRGFILSCITLEAMGWKAEWVHHGLKVSKRFTCAWARHWVKVSMSSSWLESEPRVKGDEGRWRAQRRGGPVAREEVKKSARRLL